MLTPVKYQPGTVKGSQHTELTSLAFTDTDHVRFQADGRLGTIPAYSATGIAGSASLTGTCRSIYAQRITGANAGDCYFFGTPSHLYVIKNGTQVNITPLRQSSQAMAANPIATTNGSSEITITFTGIGTSNALGDRIKLSGLTATGGIGTSALNKEHIITQVLTANTVKVDTGVAASSTATGGGAGGLIFYQIASGNESQETAAGMGAGEFGGGLFGAGGVSTTGVQTFPRIWSFDAFGDDCVMCPGDRDAGEGQYIYIWDGNTDIAPTKLTNAPTDCNWVMVVNNSIVALCGRTVKICELGSGTVWSGLLYREKSLERVDIVHSGFRHGDKNAVLHYGNGMILLQYVGGSDIWDFSDLFEDDAVISPHATARLGASLVMQCRRGFYAYDGGIVQRVENTQNMDWINKNINTSKIWHSFAYADPENQEVYFHFATGAEYEPSDYVIMRGNTFTLGVMTRTAAQRPGMFSEVFYAANGGDVYIHFTRGAVTFDWFAETSLFYAQGGETRMLITEIEPNSVQSGNVTVQIFSREYPQSADVLQGTWTITPGTNLISVKAAGRYLKMRFSGSSAAVLGMWRQNVRFLGRRQGNAS